MHVYTFYKQYVNACLLFRNFKIAFQVKAFENCFALKLTTTMSSYRITTDLYFHYTYTLIQL